MAAPSHLKTQTQQLQTHSHHSQSHSNSTAAKTSKRRKRRETVISASASASASSSPSQSSVNHVVSSDANNWCCAPSPPSASIHSRATIITDSDPATATSESPSRSWTAASAMDQNQQQQQPPPISFPAYPNPNPNPTYPSSYSKFNSALNAGLLNPMSPPPLPLDKTRSSPTLFDMMANEQEYHPRGNQILPPVMPPPPPVCGPPRAMDRQMLLQERVAELLGNCSPGNQFNDPDSSDVRLTLASKDGLTVSLSVHRQILVAHSRFFAAKLSDRWSKQQRSLPHIVEISDCDDVEVYIETLRLMYCKDLRRQLMKEDVSKVLGILKVSAAIVFDAGVLSCLEYLEAAPWAEDDDEKVAALLTQLHLENSGAGEVLKRVSLESASSSFSTEDANGSAHGSTHENGNGNGNKNGIGNGNGGAINGGEEILIRLLQVVLEGKDEKARREMKGLVSKMLRESNNGSRDLSKESLYSACNSCINLLHTHFTCAAAGAAAAADLADSAAQIARQADNLHWMLDILIDRQIADDFLRAWAAQTELAAIHHKVPAIQRYEISRVTARLFVGVGKGQILVSKDSRCLLLNTWLEPFYDDFGWMRRACKGLDRHLIEDGLANTILTLPLAMQQEILLRWFDRFLNSGEDCPNIQRGFEVWWRRAFWKRNGEEQEQPPRIRITAVENS